MAARWLISQALTQVAKKPNTFHQSHDTEGINCQRLKFNIKPNSKPAQAPVPVVRVVKIPKKNTANTGPLISDPILLMATNMVVAISATKNDRVKVTAPQNTVNIRE